MPAIRVKKTGGNRAKRLLSNPLEISGIEAVLSGLFVQIRNYRPPAFQKPGSSDTIASMVLWFASGNIHKQKELQAVLKEAAPGWELKIPAEGGLVFNPAETGAAFAENAFIKAGALYRLTSAAGLAGPVIADDSGLCVDALGGRPGVLSARFGSETGQRLTDGERNELLLQEIGDNPRRAARFVCAMVLLFSEHRFFLAQETLEGEIVKGPCARGRGGFGYDPILYLPEQGCTVAELSEEEKNRISHRGKAARVLAELLTKSGAAPGVHCRAFYKGVSS
jgi:XTP/dITP diphosphohydrolase